LLVITSAFFLLNYEKTTIHIYLNQFVGNKFLDNFFYYITYLGDGTLVPVVILILLAVNIRLSVLSLCSLLVATAISTILKFYFYNEVMRPAFVFEWYNHTPLHYVAGLKQHIANSFPSGHATQIFALFMCIIFFVKNKYLKLALLILAVLGAFSRVYLSQHWLVDITAGSIIGTLVAAVCYYIFILRNLLPNIDRPLLKNKI
jgi:membrane-associated phospholipid phosphatase